jgi:Bacterial pre-peptidase C-terminal domain/Putative binding domain, N-terminal/Viral BACON domain
MNRTLLLPRAVRWILLSITLMLFAVALPSVRASKALRSAAPGQDQASAWSAAPVAGVRSPAADFRTQTKGTVALPSQVYRLSANPAETVFELQPLSQRQTLAPRQIGVGRDVGLLSATEGRRFVNADGTVIRLLALKSPDAVGLRIHFQGLDLPPGDQLFIYGKTAESRVEGPITGKGPFKDGEFWSGIVDGDTAIVEHFMSGAEHPFRLSEVSHLVSSVNPADVTPNLLGCHQDAMCFSDPEKNSVARFTFIEGADSFVCTGSILTDRAADFQPFFLTAGHCISTEAAARTMQLFWFYRTTACNSGIVSTSFFTTTGGTTLLATDRSSDSTLLRILGTIPGNLWFSGWDPAVKTIGTPAFSLSHPEGGTPPSILSYLRRASGQVTNTATGCSDTGLQNGYIVNWSAGATEPGSSGSGLWTTSNGQNYLIGVLSCGPTNPACTSNLLYGLYGKFSNFYPMARPFIDVAATCTSSSIGIGQTVSGELTSGDCQSTRKGLSDRYTFNANAGQQVAVAVNSAAFDAYAYLLNPSGVVVNEDDDSGGGTNARIPASGFVTLTTGGTYTIEVTSFSGTATGSYNLTLSGAASCAYTINPTGQSFTSGGGSGSLNVNVAAGCAWSATSNASWLTVNSGASGNGNGTVSYSVQANTGASRVGTLTVAGQTFTVSEDGVQVPELRTDDGSFENIIGLVNGGTDYVVNRLTPSSYPATLSAVSIFWRNDANSVKVGNTFNVLVGTHASGVNINNTSLQSFPATVQALGQFNVYDIPDLTINSGDFIIGFRITYPAGVFPTALDQTPPSQRRSYVSQDGVSFFIIDDVSTNLTGNFGIRARMTTATSCSYAVAPTAQNFGAGGGSASVAITTAASCQWSATSHASWITITSSASGVGNGSISYFVSANTGGARSDTLTVAGQTVTINQAGSGPVILSAVVAGKQLLVSGQSFDSGALIFMDGARQKKVFNDDSSPTTLLIAAKSGKLILHGQTVILQVVNASGATSPPFSYTRP